MSESFDVVIVGAGSSGCVLAARLAEAGRTVCLLEAGPGDRSLLVEIPAGYVKNLFNPQLTWGFMSEPLPGTAERRISLPQGRLVGGSSSINGMVYNRGQPGDYDGWAAMGADGWSYRDVLPWYRKSERRVGPGDDAYRGRDGPLTVSDLGFKHPLCDLWIQAAEELGYKSGHDYAGPSQEGVGSFQFTMDAPRPFRRRMSAARAFLRPALRTGRIALRTSSPATGLEFEGRRAVGVRYLEGGFNGPERRVSARQEVILCAGAINTPRLLQISGIGPAEHLRSIGVDVLLDAPGVGANLSDHYQFRLTARVRGVDTLNERGRGRLRLAREVLRWMAGRPSMLAMAPVVMRLFARSRPELPTVDVQMSFTPASFQEGLPGLLDHFPGMSLGGYQQRPTSRGHVLAVSKNVADRPVVQPNYLNTEEDRAALLFVVRNARRLLATRAFAPHLEAEIFPGPQLQSPDEIIDFARQRGATSYHHTGTARMGRDGDPMAVVDPKGRVRGIERLRIADASIFPAPISGNTNAPSIMTAERMADFIVQAR